MSRPPDSAPTLLMRRPPRGQFNLPTVLVLLVLLVVAVIALRYALQQAQQKKARASEGKTVVAAPAAPAAATPPQPNPATPATATTSPTLNTTSSPRPDPHGLSFGLMPTAPGAPRDTAHVGCHAEPKLFGRPHQGSCNPYQGDTACNIVLPVLCIKPNGASAPGGLTADFYSGWVHGSLGASEPVMGALLDSPQAASRQCERTLGPGWRVAEFHDGRGGWGLQGQRGPGLRDHTRYWVHINDQPGNCWN